MLVHCDVLDGIGYEIHIVTAVEEGWKPEDMGKFYAICPGYEFKLFNSYENCVACIEHWISEEIANTPSTVEGLVADLSDLLVWENYEECYFDTNRATKLIQNFLNKHYERKD